MLINFKVSYFKSFEDNFELNLKAGSYSYNSKNIKNGYVNNAMIYGDNGIGKSNLGIAIFDIISNLTDNEKGKEYYINYKNLYNKDKIAMFEYTFKFGESIVEYVYTKLDHDTIIYEMMTINEDIVIMYSRNDDLPVVLELEGTENLNMQGFKESKLSIVKYIMNNSLLVKNERSNAFISLNKFAKGMLFFRSLERDKYIGLDTGNRKIEDEIVKANLVKDLETFLNECHVECKLSSTTGENGDNKIVMDFNGELYNIYSVASSGTISLILLFYWIHKLKELDGKFMFIDEFDAFYNYKVSKAVVRLIQDSEIQSILTTHNLSIMTNDLSRPDCYFIMNKKSIKPMTMLTNKELRQVHNLEKLYKGGTFNLY